MARAHAAITAVFVCAFLCFVLVSAMDPMQVDPQGPLGHGSANALAQLWAGTVLHLSLRHRLLMPVHWQAEITYPGTTSIFHLPC